MIDTITLSPATGLGKALTLRLCALAGLILFGPGFALTFLSLIHYEKACATSAIVGGTISGVANMFSAGPC